MNRFCHIIVVSILFGLSLPALAQNAKPKVIPRSGKPLWQRPLVCDVNDISGREELGRRAKVWLEKANQQLKNEALIPGFVPLVIGDFCINRNYLHTQCLPVKPMVDIMGKTKAGGLYWQTVALKGTLANLLEHPETNLTIANWLNVHSSRQNSNVILQNSIAKTSYTDGKMVYIIEDLTVIPPESTFDVNTWFMRPKITKLLLGNTLHAYDLRYGKIMWRRNGYRWLNRDDADFVDSHFLSLPLSRAGLIYCLNETNNGVLRLACLEPKYGKKKWLLDLDVLKNTYLKNALRRLQTVKLAVSGDLLICPTHAGIIYAIDLKKRKLRWKFDGHKPPPPKKGAVLPQTKIIAHWHHPKPIIAKDRVVFTSPVDPSVWCLDLNGQLKWKSKWEDGLYLAGIFDDTVLVVGKSSIRGLSLKNGNVKWKTKTGITSGLGAVRDGWYFLPLKNPAKGKWAEICILNPRTGAILRRVEMKGQRYLGNLAFARNQLISQSTMYIAAFPLETTK